MDMREIMQLAELIRATPINSDDRARVDYSNASRLPGNLVDQKTVFGKLGLSNNFSGALLSELEQASGGEAEPCRRRAQRSRVPSTIRARA